MSITEGTTVADTEPVSGNPLGDTGAVGQDPIEGEKYTVKVDGSEVEVSLDELRNGYQRQQDYTKKTQEVAEMRKRLQGAEALAAALDRDPVGTLNALNEAYNIDQPSGKDGKSWDEMDPQEQRLARIEQQLQGLQTHDARSTIEAEFRQLEQAYGDIDRSEVAAYALQHDLNVTDAYRVMNFDSIRAEQERLRGDAKVTEDKRNAQLPHQGSAQKGALAPATPGKKMTLREAYQAAMKQVTNAA